MNNLFQEMLLQVVSEWNDICRDMQTPEYLLEYKDAMTDREVFVAIKFINGAPDMPAIFREVMRLEPSNLNMMVPAGYVKNELLQQACKRLMLNLMSQGIDKGIRMALNRPQKDYPINPDYPGINGTSFKLEIKDEEYNRVTRSLYPKK